MAKRLAGVNPRAKRGESLVGRMSAILSRFALD